MNEECPLLSLEHITKDFDGTVVLSDVSFSLRKGEILGLVGENGAGKTTLMSILFGMPVIAETGGFQGSVVIDGETASFRSPFDALDAGIGMVHQEFSLISAFSTTENILLNRECVRPSLLNDVFGDRMSVLDTARMRDSAQKAIEKLGVSLDPDMLVSEMPVGHKQFTEIAREINRQGIRVLVLDEPTAVLTEGEAEVLLKSMKALSKEGIAIIFISHRLHEVLEVADRLVVLRDGKLVKDVSAEGISVKEVSSWMVGRDVDTKRASGEHREFGPEFLKLDKLWVDMPGERVNEVSISVRSGEIFGIGGLAGQGKLGIPNGVMGLQPAGGEAVLDGASVPLGDPHAALAMGMAFVSEDRRGVGLLLDESLDWNIAFTAMQVQDRYLKPIVGKRFLRFRDDRGMRALAQEYVEALEIKCTGVRQKAKELSGGNQQKVCLAKAFAIKPKLLFVSEPTRGIDVGAKRLVLDALLKYNRENGMTIVMISSELEELRSICDRIAIVDEGHVAGILPPDAPREEFGLLLSGRGATEEARRIDA